MDDEGDVQGLGELELDNANSCFTFGHTDIIINTNVDDDKAQDFSFQYDCEEEYQRQGAVHFCFATLQEHQPFNARNEAKRQSTTESQSKINEKK